MEAPPLEINHAKTAETAHKFVYDRPDDGVDHPSLPLFFSAYLQKSAALYRNDHDRCYFT